MNIHTLLNETKKASLASRERLMSLAKIGWRSQILVSGHYMDQLLSLALPNGALNDYYIDLFAPTIAMSDGSYFRHIVTNFFMQTLAVRSRTHQAVEQFCMIGAASVHDCLAAGLNNMNRIKATFDLASPEAARALREQVGRISANNIVDCFDFPDWQILDDASREALPANTFGAVVVAKTEGISFAKINRSLSMRGQIVVFGSRADCEHAASELSRHGAFLTTLVAHPDDRNGDDHILAAERLV